MAADAVLTFAAEGILNKVLSLPAQEFSLVWGFKAQLGKLKQSLTDVERFLVDVADNPQGRPKSIEEWVKKLKDVAEDAEDVLDEFEYEVARRKVEIQNHIKKKVCTARMNLHDEVDLEDYVSRPDKISAAEISAICQEAGMHAVRKNRYVILPNDFEKGYQTNVKKPDTDFEFYK